MSKGKLLIVDDEKNLRSSLQAILRDEPVSLRRREASIPADLAVIVGVAMEKDLARRYQTAADFAEDLRRFLDHEGPPHG